MIACFVRCKSKFPFWWSQWWCDEMIVFYLLNDYVHSQILPNNKSLILSIPYFCHIVAHYHCIIGKFFIKAPRFSWVQVKIQLKEWRAPGVSNGSLSAQEEDIPLTDCTSAESTAMVAISEMNRIASPSWTSCDETKQGGFVVAPRQFANKFIKA